MNFYQDMITTNHSQLVGVNIDTGDVVIKATAVEQHKQDANKTLADSVYFEAAMRELIALPQRLEALIKQVNELSDKVSKLDVLDVDELADRVISEIDLSSLATDVASEIDIDEIANQVSECIDIADLADRVKDDISDDVVTEAVKEIANRLHRR
jgi:inactivated superfamily I helicase